jgi:hypothetical protein
MLELLQAVRWAVLGELQTTDAAGKPTWMPDVFHKGFGFQRGEPDVVFHALLKLYASTRWPWLDLHRRIRVRHHLCEKQLDDELQKEIDDALTRKEEPVLCFNSAPVKSALEERVKQSSSNPQEKFGIVAGSPLTYSEIQEGLKRLSPSDGPQPHGVVIATKETDGALVIKDSAFNDLLPKSSWKIQSVDALNFVFDDGCRRHRVRARA